ncbi:MAG: terminase family protein, partial [Bryobacterales bacterium]|nr:terminase family protein [Bryobacterales bacterium]
MTDERLRYYILNPVAFTRDLLGLQPDPLQAEILSSRARRGILCCTRQWGKSTIVAAKAVHQAFLHPDSTILVSGPCERQSALLVRKCADMLLTLGVPKRGDGHNRISLELPNGSRIIGLPHTETNIRGFSAPSLILIDEAAVVHDSIYHALVPMQATNDGALWLLSTPREKRGFFYNEWIASDTDWHKIRATALDCPRISQAWLDRRARRLPKAAFEQEFLCVFRSSQLSLFQDEDLQAALAPTPTLDRPVRVYLGLDLGQRHDHSALAVLYLHQYYTGRIDPGTRAREARHILQLKTIQQIPLETPYQDVAQIVRHQLQHFEIEGKATVIIDAGGPGLPFIDFLTALPLRANLIKLNITGTGAPHLTKGIYQVTRA